MERVIRLLGAYLGALLYKSDLKRREALVRTYRLGFSELAGISPCESWRDATRGHSGFRVHRVSPSLPLNLAIPFVYEDYAAPNLAELREQYRLGEFMSDVGDEYDAMLRLGAWLGTRWDHGMSVVPGGTRVCNPIDVIAAGECGAKFWCEIAAKVAVLSATAVGWPARLATASRDGYTWEHAVAELWSNSFDKWFVLDTDFNLVYEHYGIPLSCFELCHRGEELRDSGALQVRQLASPKPSLPMQDLVPFYRYVHIDLRNDWCSRPLAVGSPAGGDRATWWTARSDLNFLLTAKRRVDDHTMFDWKVNSTLIYPLTVLRRAESLELKIGLCGYSPRLQTFEIAVDTGAWEKIEGSEANFDIREGKHTIRARLCDDYSAGPVAFVEMEFRLC